MSDAFAATVADGVYLHAGFGFVSQYGDSQPELGLGMRWPVGFGVELLGLRELSTIVVTSSSNGVGNMPPVVSRSYNPVDSAAVLLGWTWDFRYGEVADRLNARLSYSF